MKKERVMKKLAERASNETRGTRDWREHVPSPVKKTYIGNMGGSTVRSLLCAYMCGKVKRQKTSKIQTTSSPRCPRNDNK